MNKRTIYLSLLVLIGISAFSQTGVITDSRDNQTYQVVKIGNLWWMAENLNIGDMIQSNTQGSQMNDNIILEKYCWDNNCDYCDGTNGVIKKGGFYEWKEIIGYSSFQHDDVQGICPYGWRIPTYNEFNSLFTEFGSGSVAVQALLEGGSSGMNIKLTGYRCTYTGGFRPSAMSNDFMAYFWTSNDTDSENAPLFEINSNSYTSFSFMKSLGLSLRCVNDSSQNTLSAEFSASEINGVDELETSFIDQSLGNPISWSWDFGDGYTSLDQNPTHTYNSVGTFTVTLVISDGSQTVSLTKENYITVESSFAIPIKEELPKSFLGQNTPNPTSDYCEIIFMVAKSGDIELKIYNSSMQQVQSYTAKTNQSEISTIKIDVTNLSDGLYFYQLISKGYSAIKKFNIIK